MDISLGFSHRYLLNEFLALRWVFPWLDFWLPYPAPFQVFLPSSLASLVQLSACGGMVWSFDSRVPSQVEIWLNIASQSPWRHKILEDYPVENVVVREAHSHEEIAEDFAQIGIFRLVFKAKRADVIEVGCELLWSATAEVLGSHCLLLQIELRLLFSDMVLSPCHGREPRMKYIMTYPRDSISSRQDCSLKESVAGTPKLRIVKSRTDSHNTHTRILTAPNSIPTSRPEHT
jgi:hypothetical protein